MIRVIAVARQGFAVRPHGLDQINSVGSVIIAVRSIVSRSVGLGVRRDLIRELPQVGAVLIPRVPAGLGGVVVRSDNDDRWREIGSLEIRGGAVVAIPDLLSAIGI